MNARIFLSSLFLIGLAGCSNGLSGLASLPPASDGNYRLSAGDKVRITVFGFDNITNQYTVSDAGVISLPMLNGLPVEGKALLEVETLVAATLQERGLARSANVSAQIVEYRPFYIRGQVQKPGEYPYVPGMTVLTAVTIAGDFTFRARQDAVAIRRTSGGKSVKWQARPDDRILPGDLVEIVERTF